MARLASTGVAITRPRLLAVLTAFPILDTLLAPEANILPAMSCVNIGNEHVGYNSRPINVAC
jgi:hypothetical protein